VEPFSSFVEIVVFHFFPQRGKKKTDPHLLLFTFVCGSLDGSSLLDGVVDVEENPQNNHHPYLCKRKKVM